MKKAFCCSLCHYGLLGGGLFVDDEAVTYRTGKVTVEKKYRDLRLERSEIADITWKWVIFPVAKFTMKDGNTYTFLIFNKWRFMKVMGGISE